MSMFRLVREIISEARALERKMSRKFPEFGH